jgi:hypothetical protein
MITYYDVLNVSPIDDNDTIYNNYYELISNYNNPVLSDKEKSEIKFIKMALYVLTNENLKNKYNYYIYKEQNKKENSLKDFKQSVDNNNDVNNNINDVNNNINQVNNNTNQVNNNTNQFSNENKVFIPANELSNDNLEQVFNVDNTWMANMDKIKMTDKNDKLDNRIISDRIFDLSNLYDRKVNYDELKISQARASINNK